MTEKMPEIEKHNRTCAERVGESLESKLETLRALWDLYQEDPEAYHDEEETKLDEYALSFDYVAPGTFNDQPEGYFRYQISYGGPSEEFRIYANKDGAHTWTIYRIEYWFLDWFDGAHINLIHDDFTWFESFVLSYFEGSLDFVHDQALTGF